MKNVQQIVKRQTGIIGMICLLAVLFSSCLKNHDNDIIPQQPVALVSVIAASPDAPALDFFLDNNRVNTYPLTYGNGLDYFRAYPGKRTAIFYNAGTNTVVKSDTMTLKANNYYSLYLANKVSTPDYLLITDSLKNPGSGMASIRLVNVSTDAPAVDLGIKGGALIASNKSYKGYSSFIPVTGNTAYTLEVRQAGTATVLASLSNITLHTGSVYTVWLHGLASATDQTRLTADIQNNAYGY